MCHGRWRQGTKNEGQGPGDLVRRPELPPGGGVVHEDVAEVVADRHQLAVGADRRAIQGVLGGVVLAAVPSSLVPRQADAGSKAKKRCRSQGRVYLPKGTCHCADGSCVVPCHDNPDCHCYQTTEGRGFCTGIGSL